MPLSYASLADWHLLHAVVHSIANASGASASNLNTITWISTERYRHHTLTQCTNVVQPASCSWHSILKVGAVVGAEALMGISVVPTYKPLHVGPLPT
jgi:hypothetical protein